MPQTSIANYEYIRRRRQKNWLYIFNWYSRGWSQLSPLGTAATNRPIVSAPGDYDDGEFGGMIDRGNRSTRKKPTPVPLCPPQTLHVVRTRTRAAAVGSQWLTAWATARPIWVVSTANDENSNKNSSWKYVYCIWVRLCTLFEFMPFAFSEQSVYSTHFNWPVVRVMHPWPHCESQARRKKVWSALQQHQLLGDSRGMSQNLSSASKLWLASMLISGHRTRNRTVYQMRHQLETWEPKSVIGMLVIQVGGSQPADFHSQI
jgi:hypothetical protein